MSILKKLLEKLVEKLAKWAVKKDSQTTPAPANDRQITQIADAVDFSALYWCWGGFSGKKAKLVDGAEIGSLKVTESKLSYKWVRGGCENLGAKSRDDASFIAALFCNVGGKWRGGKFDWVSTNRTSRDLKNTGGYGGWDPDAVRTADAFAFVIVSEDGKKRTNVALFAK